MFFSLRVYLYLCLITSPFVILYNLILINSTVNIVYQIIKFIFIHINNMIIKSKSFCQTSLIILIKCQYFTVRVPNQTNIIEIDIKFSLFYNIKMISARRFLLLIFLFAIAAHLSTANDPKVIQSKINWLYQRLYKNYWKRNQQYVFPATWEHRKGLFASSVHVNLVDRKNTDLTASVRNKVINIPDINMFVTSFAIYGLLEAKQLGTIKPDSHLISEALMEIANFRDKNSPTGVPQYVFWPQVKVNGTWSARSSNIAHTISKMSPPDSWKKFLTRIGLGSWYAFKKMFKYFCIPPDNDDSSVNLALLGLMKETNSTHYQFWNSLNYKKQAYYDQALKYAYRPFGANKLNPRGDQIDPRSYLVLREFIETKRNQSQNPSLILPTTWLLNYDQVIEYIVEMPFSSNNVDASVCANFLFGLSYQLIQGQIKLNDQLKQMVINVVELLQYTVTKVLLTRPTLILVYYPSIHDFYWFIARTVGLLKRYENLPEPLSEVRVRLEKLMKQVATKQIIDGAVKNQNGVYWRQFLGNFGKKQRNQDAIFSTSLALNALLDTWTVRKGSNIKYDNDITDEVKNIIHKGVSYLLAEIKPKMKQMNAFFSGSMKLMNNTLPYFFPANVVKDNGKLVDPTTLKFKELTFDTITHVKGVIDPKQYQQWLTKKWYQHEVPQKEVDFNSQIGMSFPFWSSSAITEIMAITSLSKYLKTLPKLVEDAPLLTSEKVIQIS